MYYVTMEPFTRAVVFTVNNMHMQSAVWGNEESYLPHDEAKGNETNEKQFIVSQ